MVDFAYCMRDLVDIHFPEAEKIVLVMDYLNTHKFSSLYEAFEPEEARRIIEKLEIHYTPKHGCWLNMAEIELSVLQRQSLKARIRSANPNEEGGYLAKSTQYVRCLNQLALYYRRCSHQITPLISDYKS